MSRLKTKVIATGFASMAMFSQIITLARAQLQGGLDQVQVGGDEGLLPFIKRLLNLALLLMSIVAVVYLVYSGFMYVTSGGDESKVEKATKGITYAIIGLIVAFASYMVVSFVVGRLTKTGE